MPTTKQRRETARRRLERQIQRRQQAALARRRRNLVTAAAFGVILVVGAVFLLVTRLGGDDPTTPAAQPTPTASTSAAAPGECTYTKGQEKATKDVGIPPNGKVPTAGTVTVNVTTSRGPMTFALDRAKAPCAVNSFSLLKFLRRDALSPGHHRGQLRRAAVRRPGWHRRRRAGLQLRRRDHAGPEVHQGVLAMANSGANTNGSKFFIVYKDTQLQPKYTVLGTVSKGLSVAEAVAKGGSDNANGDGDGKPKLPISITKMQVVSSS